MVPRWVTGPPRSHSVRFAYSVSFPRKSEWRTGAFRNALVLNGPGSWEGSLETPCVCVPITVSPQSRLKCWSWWLKCWLVILVRAWRLFKVPVHSLILSSLWHQASGNFCPWISILGSVTGMPKPIKVWDSLLQMTAVMAVVWGHKEPLMTHIVTLSTWETGECLSTYIWWIGCCPAEIDTEKRKSCKGCLSNL